MMKKPAVNHHKAHMSLGGLVGQAAARGRHVSPRVPGDAAAGRPACLQVRAAGLAFAAVRPAFFAPCMVEAAVAEPGGTPTAVAAAVASAGPAAGWDGRLRAGCRHPGAAGDVVRRRRRQGGRRQGGRRQGGGGSRPTGRGCSRRRQQNGQIEHFSQVAKGLRKGMRRGAAITPRERAVVRDLRLTTLGNGSCVQSSIFGFLMT